MTRPVRVLFVCLGNICRSPTAEGIFRHRLEEKGLTDRVLADSCGTAGWHEGKAPDSRSIETAMSRGIDLSGLRARQFRASDLDTFDYILTMDRQNLADVRDIWRQQGGTEPRLFLDLLPDNPAEEVPDPYYGGDEGFRSVFDLIESASDALIADIQARFP